MAHKALMAHTFFSNAPPTLRLDTVSTIRQEARCSINSLSTLSTLSILLQQTTQRRAPQGFWVGEIDADFESCAGRVGKKSICGFTFFRHMYAFGRPWAPVRRWRLVLQLTSRVATYRVTPATSDYWRCRRRFAMTCRPRTSLPWQPVQSSVTRPSFAADPSL